MAVNYERMDFINKMIIQFVPTFYESETLKFKFGLFFFVCTIQTSMDFDFITLQN